VADHRSEPLAAVRARAKDVLRLITLAQLRDAPAAELPDGQTAPARAVGG
jgi:hypothetical protein